MHLAVEAKAESCVEALLANGANYDIADSNGQTPLDYAQNSHEILSLFPQNTATAEKISPPLSCMNTFIQHFFRIQNSFLT